MHLNMSFTPITHGFMFQSPEDHNDNFPPSCPPQLFNGGNGGGPLVMMKRSMSFSGVDNNNNNNNGDDDLSDDGSQLLGEKKKRLNLEQVKALEKSFDLGNKLEPERKVQLAKALGLQPRQIAIWFQNRRARWKTKQLERDYEVLKKQFDSLKADNDSLVAQNKKLHAELRALKQENEGSWNNNNGSESSTPDHNHNNALDPVANSLSTSKNLFPTFLQGSSRSDHLQSLKMDQHHHQVQDESLCNLFNGGTIDEQQQHGYWTWPEQQQFH